MAYNFSSFKERLKQGEEWLRRELGSIRTGRANPSVLDSVEVESYGTKMAVREVATITAEDARTLRITPYDETLTKAIEKAIVQASLGLSVAVDDKGVRLSFPELTADRRDAFVKLAKEKLEESRIKLRGFRDEVWKDIQTKEKAKAIGEDEKFRLKEEMEKLSIAASKVFEDLFGKKEKEIHS